MASGGPYDHTGSDGSTPDSRIHSVQGPNIWWGENINQAQQSTDTSAIAQQLFNGWFNEQPPNDIHRQNILGSNYTMEGIGVAQASDGNIFVTQDFSS
jgi:uncharacterized protein YkwD